MDTTVVIPVLSILIPITLSIGGFLVAYGQMKEKMLTKEQFKIFCDASQLSCSGKVSEKIDNVATSVRELKCLVVDLHEKQSHRIDQMDDKREDARELYNKELRAIVLSIGRIEGHIRKE